MKYRRLNIEDYLMDRSFIQWVKNPDGPQKLFWQAWLDANPDQKESIIMAREIILTMKTKSFEITEKDYDEVLGRLLSRNAEKEPVGLQNWHRSSISGLIWRIAAILVTVFSISLIGYFLNTSSENDGSTQEGTYNSKITNAKQRLNFNLPDGTVVSLNQSSRLTYPSDYGKTNRRVYLVGEAYFEVASDLERPFIVKSGNMLIKALGTSFNVNTRDQLMEVALITGSVQVWLENSEDRDVILQPGERAIYKELEKIFEVTEFNTLEIMGWKDGILHFQNATFIDVKDRLEKWYDVKIVIEGLPQFDWNYSGTFKQESLERTLDRISYTKGFTFTIENDVVHLKF